MPRGSAPGERRGGRKKGSINKATAAKVRAIEASGLLPLDFMLQVMRDEGQPLNLRASAAKDAAPYIHPRLAQIEHGNKDGKPFLVALASEDGGVL